MMDYFLHAFEWAKANDNMLGALGSTVALLTLFITNGALIMRKIFGQAATATPESIPSINYREDAPDYGDMPAIACLPFIDRGLSDPNFADGLLDDVISLVQKDRLIAAAPRTSVEEYRERKIDIRRIARTLGVGYILEGSLREGNGKIRLTIQLLDRKGATIWSDRFDINADGSLDAQDKMAAQITETIHNILAPPIETEPIKVVAEIMTPAVASKTFPVIKEKSPPWHVDTGRALVEMTERIKSAKSKATSVAKDAHDMLDPETAKIAKGFARKVGFSLDDEPKPSKKSRSVSILLCLLGFVPGIAGLHRFYVGRPWTGLLYILTGGLFFIGTALDFIVLLAGAFGDGKGHPVIYWSKDQLKIAQRKVKT